MQRPLQPQLWRVTKPYPTSVTLSMTIFPIIRTPILHEMFLRTPQRPPHLLRLDNLLGVAFAMEPDVGLRVDARPAGRGPRPPSCDVLLRRRNRQ